MKKNVLKEETKMYLKKTKMYLKKKQKCKRKCT